MTTRAEVVTEELGRTSAGAFREILPAAPWWQLDLEEV